MKEAAAALKVGGCEIGCCTVSRIACPCCELKAMSASGNARTQQEAEQAERAMKGAAAALKVGGSVISC
jgi:hypothetical protein